MDDRERVRDIFERVSGIGLQGSEALLSGVATAAAVFLVIAVAQAAFRRWSDTGEDGIDEMELLAYLLRALLLLFVLGAMMFYMKRSTGSE